jgi:hypothetical protein
MLPSTITAAQIQAKRDELQQSLAPLVRAIQGEMQAGRITEPEARRRVEMLQRGISERVQALDNMLQYQQRAAAAAATTGASQKSLQSALGTSKSPDATSQSAAAATLTPSMSIPMSAQSSQQSLAAALSSQAVPSPKPQQPSTANTTSSQQATPGVPAQVTAQSHPVWSGQMAWTVGDPASGTKREMGVYVGIIAMSLRMLVPL